MTFTKEQKGGKSYVATHGAHTYRVALVDLPVPGSSNCWVATVDGKYFRCPAGFVLTSKDTPQKDGSVRFWTRVQAEACCFAASGAMRANSETGAVGPRSYEWTSEGVGGYDKRTIIGSVNVLVAWDADSKGYRVSFDGAQQDFTEPGCPAGFCARLAYAKEIAVAAALRRTSKVAAVTTK